MKPGSGEDERRLSQGRLDFIYIHSYSHLRTLTPHRIVALQPGCPCSQSHTCPSSVSRSLQYLLGDAWKSINPERSFHHDTEGRFKLQTHLKELTSCLKSLTMMPTRHLGLTPQSAVPLGSKTSLPRTPLVDTLHPCVLDLQDLGGPPLPFSLVSMETSHCHLQCPTQMVTTSVKTPGLLDGTTAFAQAPT